MPRKGMRSVFFHSQTPSFSISSHSSPCRRWSFSESMVDQSIDTAAAMIMKWNPDCSTYAKVTSLFHENKSEAKQFLRCVSDLQKAMELLIKEDSMSEKLVYAQNLMQIAMKRLQKEFYQILSMNRAYLDPESVSARSSRASTRSSLSDFDYDTSPDDDEVRIAGESISEVEQVSSIAMADLKAIAESMISTGYAKECLNIYKIIRKSIIDEGIYRLGVEKWSSSQIKQMDWEVLEMKIKNWLEAVRVSMRTLFFGERILCNHVFSASESIRESCFADISKEGASLLFGFPDIVAKSKKSPEKMFRLLDMYTAISENWPEIESIFSFDSTSSVRSQALESLTKLTESVRVSLSDFESNIQKDSSKSPVPGGGVHALTLYAMKYLSLLADYNHIITNIFAEWPRPVKTSLPESYFHIPTSDDSPAPAISVRVAWLILLLLCKLDSKAKHFKDVSLSYLFLANNFQHVVTKVRTSNLQYILGNEWITKHENKVKQFAANYQRLAWEPILTSLPENPTAAISPGEAKNCLIRFNWSFEEAYRKQSSSIVPESKLRDEIKYSIARKVVKVYRQFYDAHRNSVGVIFKFAPDDVDIYLSDLFFGTNEMGSNSSSSSKSSSLNRRRHFWSRPEIYILR